MFSILENLGIEFHPHIEGGDNWKLLKGRTNRTMLSQTEYIGLSFWPLDSHDGVIHFNLPEPMRTWMSEQSIFPAYWGHIQFNTNNEEDSTDIEEISSSSSDSDAGSSRKRELERV